MAKDGKWKRSDNRTVTVGGNQVKPIVQKLKRVYDDDNEIDRFIDFFEAVRKDNDPENRLSQFEDWTKQLLKNKDLPTNTQSKEFRDACIAKKINLSDEDEPFSDVAFAKEVQALIKHSRIVLKNGLTEEAFMVGARLEYKYSLFLFKRFETMILRGIHATKGGGAITKETIDLWKAAATQFYKSRTKKPNKTQIYNYVSEQFDAKLSTVKKHLKEHTDKLIDK